MTEVPEVKYKNLGNLYGCRNWIEYGLNQSKNELGWADFRLIHYQDIEKWWEIVYSTYLLVILFTNPWSHLEKSPIGTSGYRIRKRLAEHPQWNSGQGWKNFLNNLRLISQPFIYFNLILPWLKVFPIPQLSLGFPRLIVLMTFFPGAVPQTSEDADFQFSSA